MPAVRHDFNAARASPWRSTTRGSRSSRTRPLNQMLPRPFRLTTHAAPHRQPVGLEVDAGPTKARASPRRSLWRLLLR
jgi:hypothetical protein